MIDLIVSSCHRGTWRVSIDETVIPFSLKDCGRLLADKLAAGASSLGFPVFAASSKASTSIHAGDSRTDTFSDILIVCEGRRAPALDDLSSMGLLLQRHSIRQRILDRATSFNEAGKRILRSGDYELAKEKFSSAVEVLRKAHMCGGETGKQLQTFALNNLAHAHLCLGEWSDAYTVCTEILGSDMQYCGMKMNTTGSSDWISQTDTVKALFRRARALQGLGAPEPALRDIKQLLQLEPSNARALKLQSDLDVIICNCRVPAKNDFRPPEKVNAVSSSDCYKKYESEKIGAASDSIESCSNSSSTLLQFHIMLRCSSESVVTFKIARGVKRGSDARHSYSLIKARAGCTVKELKRIIAATPDASPHAANAMKVVYRGMAMQNLCLVGDYTGLNKAKMAEEKQYQRAEPLLVLAGPLELPQDEEVIVEVTLPNKLTVRHEVSPQASLYDVKQLLSKCHGIPTADQIEIFCALRREPLPSAHPSWAKYEGSKKAKVEEKLKAARGKSEVRPCLVDQPTISVEEALELARPFSNKDSATRVRRKSLTAASMPKSSQTLLNSSSKLSLLLLPSMLFPMPDASGTMKSHRITLYDQLDKVFPTSKEKKKGDSQKLNKGTRSDVSNGLSLAEPAPRPPRKESRGRKAFAGLKRGFFTPKKKSKKPTTRSSPPGTPDFLDSQRHGAAQYGSAATEAKRLQPSSASCLIEVLDAAVDVPEVAEGIDADFKSASDNQRGEVTLEMKSSTMQAKASEDSSTPERIADVCSGTIVQVDERKIHRGCGGKPRQRSSGRGRCSLCLKKLKPWELTSGLCRCGGHFCAKHIHFAAHGCTYDFSAHSQAGNAEKLAAAAIPAKLQQI